jgi:hypothetical protein
VTRYSKAWKRNLSPGRRPGFLQRKAAVFSVSWVSDPASVGILDAGVEALKAPRSIADADGQHDGGQAFPLQAALDRGGGFVVQQALIPSVFAEDQLAGEERRLRKLAPDVTAQFFSLPS